MESFTYDLAGNLQTATDRKGQVTTYSHDAVNRRTVEQRNAHVHLEDGTLAQKQLVRWAAARH
jgi:YD repeat-containing protein